MKNKTEKIVQIFQVNSLWCFINIQLPIKKKPMTLPGVLAIFHMLHQASLGGGDYSLQRPAGE